MEATVVCPHCSRDISVVDELSGALAACPLCAGVFTVPSSVFAPPSPPRSVAVAATPRVVTARPRVVSQQRRPIVPTVVDYGPKKVTFGTLGILLFGIVFLIDAPDYRRIAQLERKLKEETSVGDRFARMARLSENLTPYVPAPDRAQAYRDSGSAWRSYDASSGRARQIATEIGEARSTNRGLWGFGLVGSFFWLLSGIFRPHSKQLL